MTSATPDTKLYSLSRLSMFKETLEGIPRLSPESVPFAIAFRLAKTAALLPGAQYA